MNSDKLKQIITEHKKSFINFDYLIPREIIVRKRDLIDSKEILVISGVRRSGKSSLLKLIARDLINQGTSPDNLLFINFDDERMLGFKIDDFDNLYNSFLELYNPIGKIYLFLDEIQNIEYWEKWVNRMYELSEVKIFVTGSNSSILKSEYSTLLTGRNRQLINYPFTFREHLSARMINPDKIDIYDNGQVAAVKYELSTYLEQGGFPEIIKTGDKSLLEQYFKDIIFRDIIIKNKVKSVHEIRELALILSSEITSIQSLANLKNVIGLKSINSIKKYLEFFNDCFLFFQLGLYSFSVKRQIYNPKKIYCIDNGLAKSVSFSFSENEGKFYENLVFMELKQRNKDIYYWKSEKNLEVDFIVKKGNKVTEAIQVCLSMENDKTRKRELNALLAARRELKAEKLLILTKDEEFDINEDELMIKVKPLWKFLISKDERDLFKN